MGKIKWREKDIKKLKNKVKSFNSKISRELTKGTDNSILPKKVSFKELKKRIITREDYNREFDLLDDFTNRYALKVEKTNRGGKVPLWLKRQTNTKLKEINKRRKEQMKIYESLPLTDRNKPIDKQTQFYRDSNLNQFKPKTVNWENKSTKDIEKFIEGLKEYEITKEQKDKLYRENYYTSIRENYSPSQAEEIIKILDDIETDVLVNKYYTDLNLNIDFNYEESDRNIRFNELIKAWNSVKSLSK